MKPGVTNSPLASTCVVAVAASRSNRNDETVSDTDVGVITRIAAAVDNRAVANDDVEGLLLPVGDAGGEQQQQKNSLHKPRYITLPLNG